MDVKKEHRRQTKNCPSRAGQYYTALPNITQYNVYVYDKCL